MDDNQRDQLLARLDERSESIHSDIRDLKSYIIAVDRKTQVLAKSVEKNTSDIIWIKGIGSGLAGLFPTVYGVIEWLRNRG